MGHSFDPFAAPWGVGLNPQIRTVLDSGGQLPAWSWELRGRGPGACGLAPPLLCPLSCQLPWLVGHEVWPSQRGDVGTGRACPCDVCLHSGKALPGSCTESLKVAVYVDLALTAHVLSFVEVGRGAGKWGAS